MSLGACLPHAPRFTPHTTWHTNTALENTPPHPNIAMQHTFLSCWTCAQNQTTPAPCHPPPCTLTTLPRPRPHGGCGTTRSSTFGWGFFLISRGKTPGGGCAPPPRVNPEERWPALYSIPEFAGYTNRRIPVPGGLSARVSDSSTPSSPVRRLFTTTDPNPHRYLLLAPFLIRRLSGFFLF